MTMQKSHSCANRSHRILLSKGLRSALAWIYFAMPCHAMPSLLISRLDEVHRTTPPAENPSVRYFYFCFFIMCSAALRHGVLLINHSASNGDETVTTWPNGKGVYFPPQRRFWEAGWGISHMVQNTGTIITGPNWRLFSFCIGSSFRDRPIN